jgi:hypothetical protein
LLASSSATTVTVGRRAITITAASKTKIYGDDDPELTYTITTGALVGSDELNGSLTRATGENVGTREIQIGTLAHPNYDITYVPANLTISKRLQPTRRRYTPRRRWPTRRSPTPSRAAV